jgi:hypothetical protein
VSSGILYVDIFKYLQIFPSNFGFNFGINNSHFKIAGFLTIDFLPESQKPRKAKFQRCISFHLLERGIKHLPVT